MVNLLQGRALDWGHAVLRGTPDLTFSDFLSRFTDVSDKESCSEGASRKLVWVKKGRKKVADYSVDFRILAEEAGWEENALRGVF